MSRTVDRGKEEVAKLCRYSTANRQPFLARNEAQVRQWLIGPLFEALGRDVRNRAMTARLAQTLGVCDHMDGVRLRRADLVSKVCASPDESGRYGSFFDSNRFDSVLPKKLLH